MGNVRLRKGALVNLQTSKGVRVARVIESRLLPTKWHGASDKHILARVYLPGTKRFKQSRIFYRSQVLFVHRVKPPSGRFRRLRKRRLLTIPYEYATLTNTTT